MQKAKLPLSSRKMEKVAKNKKLHQKLLNPKAQKNKKQRMISQVPDLQACQRKQLQILMAMKNRKIQFQSPKHPRSETEQRSQKMFK